MTKFKPKGVLFKELSSKEKEQIQVQFKRMFETFDPNIEKYRFYFSVKYGWIITNANTLPLQTNTMRI